MSLSTPLSHYATILPNSSLKFQQSKVNYYLPGTLGTKQPVMCLCVFCVQAIVFI